MKQAVKANFSTHDLRARLFRGLVVLLLEFAAVQGLTPDVGWSEFAHLLTPAVVFPMVGAVLVAMTTTYSRPEGKR